METSTNLDKILNLINGLLAKADSTDSEAEAAALRGKAEELMRKYRIEEENLIAADPGTLTPISKEFDLVEYGHEFYQEIYGLWYYIAAHCGIRFKLGYADDQYRITAVGYASDLRYAELLFVSARLVFGAKLTPEVDPKESDTDNVYRLRSSGLTRRAIAMLLWGEDTHAAHAKVGKLYAAGCVARGEDPVVSGREINAKTYRTAFANAFGESFRYRLFLARQAASATGGGLELSGREDRVNEAFYTMFPSYRPQPKAEQTPETAPQKAKAKKAAKVWKPTKADEARDHRLYHSRTARLARRAGDAAAADVRIARTSGTEELQN